MLFKGMSNKKTFIIVLIFALFLSCNKSVVWGPEQEVGKYIYPFELKTIDGETVSSSTLKGKEAVIVFFNTWCPDCHEVLPVIQEWMEEDMNGTTYLCIARGQTNDEIIPFWEENGFAMKAAADPGKEIYNLFTGGKPYGVPLIYMVDKRGLVWNRILQNEKLSRF